MNHAWRGTNEHHAYFPFPTLQAVVVAYFLTKPTRPTQQRIFLLFQDSDARARNAYDATHDSLTGLLNRAAFEAHLVRKLKNHLLERPKSPEEILGLNPPTSLLIIAIDIDFFKQVNDSFGHVYGDLVLQSFAIRLENACASFDRDISIDIDFVCARPSGEEFGIIVTGPLSPDIEIMIAEHLRSAIANAPLPNDVEWELVTRDISVDLVDFPHASERRVTASIGLTAIHTTSPPLETDRILEQLKTQADLALFRAKTAGRNRCVKYADILTKFGKILQHHRDTDVVAIDLGRQVKVSLGQEFYVFHPQFSGVEPFVFRDGRTERKLGVYPKVPCGRIEVFDVQPEISFAYIQKRRGIDIFPTGSLLEAIPIGSIGHLIKEEWWRGDKGDLAKLGRELVNEHLQRLGTWADDGDDVMVFVVGLGNEDEIANSRGVGFVNKALAAMYTHLHRVFIDVDAVAQVANNVFAIVSGRYREDLQAQVLDMVKTVTEELEDIPRFVVGVYVHSEVRASERRGDQSEYSIQNALDYALFAVGGEDLGPEGVLRFSRKTPQAVLLKARREGAYDQVQKDYQTLKGLGVVDANVENQRALALFESGSLSEGVKAAEAALQLSPDDRILQANLALLAFASGDRARAGRLFVQLEKPDELKSKFYLVARAMGLYELFKSDGEAVDREQLVGLLERARQGPRVDRLNVTSLEILLALMKVRGDSAAA